MEELGLDLLLSLSKRLLDRIGEYSEVYARLQRVKAKFSEEV